MKNIYLLAGPSGSGKSSVARELTQRYGLKEVWSYTERPPRFDGEPGHIFVTPEQFDAAGKMCAFTLYDGYRYGVPESAIEENDIYVIDPAGIRYMWERYSGSKEVVVIAIYAPQEERAERMLERGDTPEAVKERLQFDVKEFENLHIMSKHITREVWAAAGDFYKAAQPGDTVDEQIVNDFRDCVPPASMSSGYLQVGEAYDHMVDENGRWRPTFMTFAFKDGVWVYCGCCFHGEAVHRERI